MLKIYPQLWYVTRSTSQGQPSVLAYMTHYEDNAACRKRQHTGKSWSGNTNNTGTICDNEPTTGFKITDSVSRWSTQNKLFRVMDPRGFEVEIPTGNLNQLLQCSTVVNGEIQGECVWGRDDSSHILIPTASVLYQEATMTMEKLNKTIKMSDIQVGEIIEASAWGSMSKMIYLGKVKATHTGTLEERSYSWHRTGSASDKIKAQLGEHTDTKWWLGFAHERDLKRLSQDTNYFSIEQRRTLKVTNRTGQKLDKDIVEQLREKISYCDRSEAIRAFHKERDAVCPNISGQVQVQLKETVWQ